MKAHPTVDVQSDQSHADILCSRCVADSGSVHADRSQLVHEAVGVFDGKRNQQASRRLGVQGYLDEIIAHGSINSGLVLQIVSIPTAAAGEASLLREASGAWENGSFFDSSTIVTLLPLAISKA